MIVECRIRSSVRPGFEKTKGLVLRQRSSHDNDPAFTKVWWVDGE